MTPTDWKESLLGNLGPFSKGQGIRKNEVVSFGLPCIRYGQIYTSHHNWIRDFTASITPEVAQASRQLSTGDLLFAGSGETATEIGKCVAFLGDQEAYAGGDIVILSPRGVDSKFMGYALNSPSAVLQKMKLAQGDAVVHISASNLASISVALPPLKEQEAIAEALSDADSAIEALDALIAKKRDVKQAAMQQLLTGRTRLPGFSGAWSEVRFGELCSPRNKRVDPRSEGGGDYCVELENLESGTGRLLGSTFTSMTSSLKTRFEAGDVLFGKLRSYLRKSWLAERSGVCSTEIWAFVARSEVARSDYLAQLVRTEAFIDATSMSYGTHMPRSDWTIVSKHLLVAPAIDEQSAIAQILGDMDEEIEALVAEREKLDLVKQGMMQELLTGRVRLV